MTRLYSRRTAGLLFGSFLLGPRAGFAATPDRLTREMIARSQVSQGDLTRLTGVAAKARRGEPVTIGVIGGSITVGAFASKPENSYAGRLLAWWQEKFPQCEFRLVNAGAGGTGSMYGALRAEKDLLFAKPDLVVIEFAVNDNWTDGDAYEGLVRQVLAQPNSPAVLLLFMMWERGGNDQDMQSKIGAYYGLPMVSFRDALWPEISAGRSRWPDYIVDTVHPNDAGHRLAARLLTTMCGAGLSAAVANTTKAGSLPPPLHTDSFQFVSWQGAADLSPIENGGWDLESGEKGIPVWDGAGASGPISFEWLGSGLVAVFAQAPGNLRRVRFRIDGGAFRTLDESTQPQRETNLLVQGLNPGRHIVEMRCLDRGVEKDDKARRVQLVGLGSTGVTQG
ncbi:MAG TPA: SGNH/GDSL hydrolase family protein [Bradyrhizobium sp.]|nr:SGNH/GDSL hydrolase family protein [Bradyrhizobium sp.]